MSERKELLELIADTRAYLLFLKETGVEEIAKGSKPEWNENELDNNVPSIVNINPDRRGFLTPPEGFSDENKSKLLNILLEKIGNCTRCKLSTGRKNIAFGTGNPNAKLMFVGEGPGEEEDRQGKPFVGKAGELLTKMISAMGLTRDDVYIANVVKCRPPGNRNPEGDEITSCSPFLKEQINIIKPEIICTLGAFATQALLETNKKISELRGKIHIKDGYRIIPTFHPAYLLRNPGEKVLSWQDLQVIMKELDIKT